MTKRKQTVHYEHDGARAMNRRTEETMAAKTNALSIPATLHHRVEVERTTLSNLLLGVACTEHMGLNNVVPGADVVLVVRSDRSVAFTTGAGNVWKNPRAAALVEAAAVLRGEWKPPATSELDDALGDLTRVLSGLVAYQERLPETIRAEIEPLAARARALYESLAAEATR